MRIKKEVSAQRREDAKGFSLRLCAFARQIKNKLTKSLPASGRSLRFSPISLRLCAFARQKKQITHTKALRAYLSSLRLPTAGWLLALVRKKNLLSQRRQAAKGVFFASGYLFLMVMLEENIHNAFGGFAVPEWDALVLFPFSAQDFIQVRLQIFGIGADQFVGSQMDRLRTLSAIP